LQNERPSEISEIELPTTAVIVTLLPAAVPSVINFPRSADDAVKKCACAERALKTYTPPGTFAGFGRRYPDGVALLRV
jgi:hypothetical protein